MAVRECDHDLGDRLGAAERFSLEIAQQIDAGQEILNRLARIAIETRPPRANEAPDPKSMLVAAQAFAERARTRVSGVAA